MCNPYRYGYLALVWVGFRSRLRFLNMYDQYYYGQARFCSIKVFKDFWRKEAWQILLFYLQLIVSQEVDSYLRSEGSLSDFVISNRSS